MASGAENLIATKENLGFPVDKEFYVPEEVTAHMNEIIAAAAKKEETWNNHG